MKPITGLFIALLYSAGAGATELDAANWSAAELKRLNGLTTLPRLAEELANRLVPDSNVNPSRVGEATFADIDGDGKLELIATLDYSGRSFFSSVIVVKKGKAGFTYSVVHSNGISVLDLPSRLVDVNQDGRKELLVEQYMDQYEGAMRVPVETAIFEWTGDKFVEASDKFPGYYRSVVIPKLEKDLAEVKSSSASQVQVDDYETFVLKAELDRAKRRGRVK
jgi:hypothetical protein